MTMYEVTVRDNLFIAHSLKDDFFGPAKNLHGATYVIDLVIRSNRITDKNVIIDIGLASKLLNNCIKAYNYKNLDDIDLFSGIITTTEFMAKQLTVDFVSQLKKEKFDISQLYSIKMILNESHVASASYEQKINE
ncbi:MAG: 6-carboxytetrahydropterin synthase [Gammaproteobacteria bacterium]|nr:6-carboxytetrahydropterin synthase [Gammaproteobacteria bacterium]